MSDSALADDPNAAASGWSRYRQAGWWAGKAFWAVLDQGLFAISNFALGVLLARWLSADAFGSFAVAQSVFLLAGTLHTGLFTEPMLVFGSARHAARFSEYFDILLRAHWKLTALGSVLLLTVAGGCALFASHTLAAAFVGVALSTPFILFGWLARRACLSRMEPRLAAAGGSIYLVALLTGSYICFRIAVLSPFVAFLLLAAAGVVSGVWILEQLRNDPETSAESPLSASEVFRDHWSYGQWAVASSALSWIPGNLYYVLLPAYAGLQSAGALRALSNLVLPITHFHQALGSLLLPALAAAAGKRSTFNKVLAGSLVLFAGGSLVYGSILTAFGTPIVRFLYHDTYENTAHVIPLIAFLPVAAALIAVLGSALRAKERPQQVFWAYTASAIGTVTLGLWVMAHWGLTGAAAGLLISSTITAAASGWYLVRGPEERGSA